MSRPLRIEFEGAWYHVMNRGAARCWVFNTDEQREYFLSLLADVHSRFGAEVHAYCLMGNHYHLLLRTPRGNLQRIMRHINGVYTQFFNRSEGRDGPLFRGRYKAVLVDAGAYWVELSRYIHRNPVEAGLVDALEDYPWSSYPAYVGLVGTPDWLMTSEVLAGVGARDQRGRYAVFMRGDCSDELRQFIEGARRPSVLGDEEFVRGVLDGRACDREVPELRRARSIPVDDVLQAVSRGFNEPRSGLLVPTRGRGAKSPARLVAMYLCYELGGVTLAEVADVFGLASYASAGSSIRVVRQRLVDDVALREKVDLIKQDLTPR